MFAQKLILSKKEEAEIRKFIQETRSKGEYRRAEAVLYKAEGLSYRAIAKKMNATYLSVYRWIQRYREGGVNANSVRKMFLVISSEGKLYDL